MQLYKGLNLPLQALLKAVRKISLMSLCLPHCTENSLEKSEFFTVFNLTLLFTSQIWSIKLWPLRELHNLNANIPSLCWCLYDVRCAPGPRCTQKFWLLLKSTPCTKPLSTSSCKSTQIHSACTPGTQVLAHEEITPGQKVLLDIFKGWGKRSRSKSWPRTRLLVPSVLTSSL